MKIPNKQTDALVKPGVLNGRVEQGLQVIDELPVNISRTPLSRAGRQAARLKAPPEKVIDELPTLISKIPHPATIRNAPRSKASPLKHRLSPTSEACQPSAKRVSFGKSKCVHFETDLKKPSLENDSKELHTRALRTLGVPVLTLQEEYEKAKGEFEMQLAKQRQREMNILNQLGISNIDAEQGLKMIEELKSIQKSVPTEDLYNRFAKRFSLPTQDAIVTTEFISEGVKYFSIRTKTGEEITVAVSEDRISVNLLATVEQRLCFILGQ